MADGFDIALLRKTPALSDLPSWQLEAIAELAEPIRLKKGATLLDRGSDDGFTYFLTVGTVSLQGIDGPPEFLEAESESARTPLANLRPRIVEVRAMKRIEAIRIPDLLLQRTELQDTHVGLAQTPNEEDEQQVGRRVEDRLPFDLYRALKSGDTRILPSLPDTAVRIQLAIDDDLDDAKTVARLVETDPAIATKVMKTANSAFYGGRSSVNNCTEAIVRLGLKTTRQLVLAFAIKEVFRTQNKRLRGQMKDLWDHSVSIAATCFVLAREVPGVPPEEALLAGLIHDVGSIALINYVARSPELASDLESLRRIVDRLRGEIGALILRSWRFAPDVAAAARDAEFWPREHRGPADVTDVVIVAQIHDRLRLHEPGGLPEIADMPAFAKVLGEDASPETSVLVMNQSQGLVEEMRSILRH